MLNEIKYNIGKVEVEDQIDVTNQLINLYPFIGRSIFIHRLVYIYLLVGLYLFIGRSIFSHWKVYIHSLVGLYSFIGKFILIHW